MDDYEEEETEEEFPEFLDGIADQLAYRPHLIVTKIKSYTPRRFRKAVKKLSKHFGIPSNLVSLISVAAMHDYELAVFGNYVYLYRLDSVFAEMSVYEPSILRSALEIETDPKVIQFI